MFFATYLAAYAAEVSRQRELEKPRSEP